MRGSSFVRSLCVALAATSSSVLARPLTDLSVTSLDVAVDHKDVHSHSPHFTLTVHRQDDLISDPEPASVDHPSHRKLIAERRSEWSMSFVVEAPPSSVEGEEHSVLLNGVRLKNGVTVQEVKMRANMLVNARNAGLVKDGKLVEDVKEKLKKLEKEFDVGLVTVQVSVKVDNALVRFSASRDPVMIRRIHLKERVIEIDGKSVVQVDGGEQIFWVRPDGKFIGVAKEATWAHVTPHSETQREELMSNPHVASSLGHSSASDSADSQAASEEDSSSCGAHAARLVNKINRMPYATKVLALGGMFMGFAIILFSGFKALFGKKIKLPASSSPATMEKGDKYSKVEVCDVDEDVPAYETAEKQPLVQ